MNVMYCSAEVEPFAKSGGLGDVMGALPKAVAQKGHAVSVVMPYYKSVIAEKYKSAMSFVGYFYTNLCWRRQYCGVFTSRYDGVDYYFLDNEYYFCGEMYCFADIERFSFFSKACLDLIGYLNKKVDVLHCNDWSTGLIPVFYDAFYRNAEGYGNIKLVYTVHNLRYQGKASVGQVRDLTGLSDFYFTEDRLLQNGGVNFMKAAIVFSDAVTTVSETYAKEILTDEFSEWLGDVINKYSYKITGILNGVDYSVYSPENDKLIFCNYGIPDAAQAKAANKAALQKQIGLPVKTDTPLIALITRLVDQKGLDLVSEAINSILQHDVQIAVLGTGEKRYEEMFKQNAQTHPDKVSANIYFSNETAHRLYAAADFVLVPSLFEPCGLTQLIGLKYGAVPIVRETGGLKDTVASYNEESKLGNGFSFAAYNAHDMLYTVLRAIYFYSERKSEFEQIRGSGMACDFGWEKSSGKYISLYASLAGAADETADKALKTERKSKTETKEVKPSSKKKVPQTSAYKTEKPSKKQTSVAASQTKSAKNTGSAAGAEVSGKDAERTEASVKKASKSKTPAKKKSE